MRILLKKTLIPPKGSNNISKYVIIKKINYK